MHLLKAKLSKLILPEELCSEKIPFTALLLQPASCTIKLPFY